MEHLIQLREAIIQGEVLEVMVDTVVTRVLVEDFIHQTSPSIKIISNLLKHMDME